MTIKITAQKNAVATAYGSNAPNGALFSADPGTTGTATTELPSTPYARQSLGWGAPSGGVINGTATFPVASGATVTHFGATGSATQGTADVRDYVAVTTQTFASAGSYTVTASYTQA